jgi:hypothetical protein
MNNNDINRWNANWLEAMCDFIFEHYNPSQSGDTLLPLLRESLAQGDGHIFSTGITYYLLFSFLFLFFFFCLMRVLMFE